eukprot:TRINITY_DN9389_c0_g1_i1.p1 TRINITY_DN9389_c0_g1~~TRINITY_DN9389_c0_g1_i1.p1  ORF type:complete len:224 (-),score=56.37 TRINITY_DN9389_c0_g1_i1:16-666(-)
MGEKYEFKAPHWRWSHLVHKRDTQKFISLLSKDAPLSTITRAFFYIEDSFLNHVEIEEQFFFPDVEKSLPAEEKHKLDPLHTEHTEEAPLFKALKSQLESLKEEDREGKESFKKAFEEFRDRLLKHNEREEAIIIPLVRQHMSEEAQKETGTKISTFMRSKPTGSVGLWQFKTVVEENPSEVPIWENSFPWVLRKAVLPGLAWTDSYIKEYCVLFA